MRLPSHFYAIADPLAGHNPVDLAKTLLEAGAAIVQLRMKQASSAELLAAAKSVHQLCRKHQALFILNDRPDCRAASRRRWRASRSERPSASGRSATDGARLNDRGIDRQRRTGDRSGTRGRIVHRLWPDVSRRREKYSEGTRARAPQGSARCGETADCSDRLGLRRSACRSCWRPERMRLRLSATWCSRRISEPG